LICTGKYLVYKQRLDNLKNFGADMVIGGNCPNFPLWVRARECQSPYHL